MQEKVHRITSLIEKYLEEQLSQHEEQELNEWLAEAESNRLFFQQITDKEILREKMKIYAGTDSAAIWQKTLQKIDGGKLVTMYPQKSSFRKYAAAAAAVILVSAGTWFYYGQKSHNQLAQTENTGATINTAILPGGMKATLILADGKKINLNEAQDGSVATQGQTQITKTDGRLIYNKESNSGVHQNIDNAYNTVTTPRGGEYHVTLPDGSKVRLNAASSLRFPIAFAGNERIVELTGEAYFEVNHLSAAKEMTGKKGKTPFIVKITTPTGARSEVEVLGTHFNVMAYEDEAAIKTTLLEGSVKVVTGASNKTIKPGEQALLNKGDITFHSVDAEDVIAWTNGFIPVGGSDFNFTMRQIGRWYDVQIKYEGKMPTMSFEGKLPRTASIADVIKVLNANNIKARLDEKERKIVITS
jgi:transmembrane sensor